MNKEDFPCCGCGSVSYHYLKTAFTSEGKFEICSECSNEKTPNLSPDVYFDPSKGRTQTDPNLCDRKTGPIPFSSKREKAAIMKRLGLRESGDKEHGARNFDRKASKQWDNFK